MTERDLFVGLEARSAGAPTAAVAAPAACASLGKTNFSFVLALLRISLLLCAVVVFLLMLLLLLLLAL